MGILGMDLTYMPSHFLEFFALFSNSNVIISSDYRLDSAKYIHSEILTDYLNFDETIYIEMFNEIEALYNKKSLHEYLEYSQKLNHFICEMPLFNNFEQFQKDLLSFDEVGNRSDPYAVFSEYKQIYKDMQILKNYREAIDDSYRHYSYKGGFPSKPVDLFGYSAYQPRSTGVSLNPYDGYKSADVEIQYVFERKDLVDGREEYVLHEKHKFHTLSEFLYLSLFKGINYGYYPKRCKLCNTFFVQEPGVVYEYCQNKAQDKPFATCRDIGAKASFSEKSKNHPVWQIYLRAYKKYFARKKKGVMTGSEFAEWVIMAEKARDEMLAVYGSRRYSDEMLEEFRDRVNP